MGDAITRDQFIKKLALFEIHWYNSRLNTTQQTNYLKWLLKNRYEGLNVIGLNVREHMGFISRDPHYGDGTKTHPIKWGYYSATGFHSAAGQDCDDLRYYKHLTQEAATKLGIYVYWRDILIGPDGPIVKTNRLLLLCKIHYGI